MKRILITLAAVWLPLLMLAQTRPLAGNVADESGEPLIGATVRVDGLPGGTATDLDGNFALEVPAGKQLKLHFSYVGYKPLTLAVGPKESSVMAKMEVEGVNIDEVVVIGYGTAKKSELTSSVETITSRDLAKIPAMNIDQSLAGQAAGLGVMAVTGDPSSARESIMSVRGNTGNPLLVIDGVPRFGSTTNEGEMRLSDLNPDDIESISVLKDAAAAAVYGARAANGVILVQTKRGKNEGKTRVNYRGQVNFDQAIYLPTFLGAEQFAELYNRIVSTDDSGLYTPYDIAAFKSDPNLYGDSNIFDHFHKWGHSQRHSVSVSGGAKALRYYLSGGYTGSKGLYSNIGRDRYNYSLKIDADLFRGLTMSIDLSGAVQKYKNNNNPVTIEDAYSFSPVEVLRYTDGSLASIEGYNPLASVLGLGGHQTTQSDFHTINAVLTYEIPKVSGLEVYAKATVDMNHTNLTQYSKPVELYVYNPVTGDITVDSKTIYPQANTTMNDRHQSVNNSLLEAGVNYNHTFAEKHHVTGLVVVNYQNYHNKYLRGTNYNLPGEKPEIVGNTSTGSISGSEYRSQRASTVGRASYGFDNRYFAEFSFRVDGSTKFAPKHRWGFFPTFSGSWVISNEPFFHGVSPEVMSQAKVRASYGILGDDGIASDFGYLQYYNTTNGEGYNFGGVWMPGLLPSISSFPNEDLTWGKSKDVNLGVDVGFWNNRVTASAEWYQRVRTNMVTNAPSYLFPPTVGTGGVTPSVNIGKMRVRGWDFSLRHRNSYGDFSYDASFNIGISDNIVLDWGDESTLPEAQKRAGKPYMVWSLYEADGLFKSQEEIDNWPVDQDGKGNATLAPGDIKYRDQDGEEGGYYVDANGNKKYLLTTNDMILVKNSAYPDISYGFGFGANWKGIFFNASFQGVHGYNQKISELYTLENGSLQRFQDYHLTNTWTEENPDADYPRLKFATGSDNNRFDSTYWIKKCNFLRLKALTVGYSFPSPLLKKAKISTVDISLQATNLFTWSSLDNADPESLRGYPLQRSYGVSLSLGF